MKLKCVFISFNLIFKDVLKTLESASKKRYGKSRIQGPVYMAAPWKLVVYPVDICNLPARKRSGYTA